MNEEDLLEVEPEYCEKCFKEAEDSGVEYEFNYYIIDGSAYCEHCNRAL